MINKTYEIIHNKYLKFFKLFLFLRYIFPIFFIAISLFLLIPKFFDYEKKEIIIKSFLIENFNLELINSDLLKYNVFPLPHISFKDAEFKVRNENFFFKTQDLKLFLDIKNIYNYKNLNIKKIYLKNNKVKIEINKIIDLYSFFNNLKSKISIHNLNLSLKKNENIILKIKKVNYSNYGYRKNKIEGESFNKKFKILIYDKKKELKLKILNTGVNAELNFEDIKKNSILVSSKINILKNYFKLKLNISNNHMEIYESNFRNKDLSISFNSKVKINPYFEIDNNISVKKFNKAFLYNLDLKEIFEKKEILKKLNSKNKIKFNQKRSNNHFLKIDSLNLYLSNGRLNFSNKNIISGGTIDCSGESLVTEDLPRLYFNCTFNILNKEKFFKRFSSIQQYNKDPSIITVVGSINLYNKKINFKKIYDKKNYNAKEEDMIFFKENFEKILFSEDFFSIFKEDKIKDFLLEVI